MTTELPIVDLTSLPIERQAEEYYLRLERGRTHKDAVEVVFYINRFARTCAELAWSLPSAFHLAT